MLPSSSVKLYKVAIKEAHMIASYSNNFEHQAFIIIIMVSISGHQSISQYRLMLDGTNYQLQLKCLVDVVSWVSWFGPIFSKISTGT
jgi:imidazole glycerol phosphate synthase subunit HisF